MVHEAHAGLLHPLVGDELELLRVVGDGVANAVRCGAPDQPPTPVALDQLCARVAPVALRRVEAAAAGLQPFDQLLAEPGDDLASGAVVHREQEDDQAAGGEAAQIAVAFDQDDVGALAAGGDGGGQAGRTATDDEHVAAGDDGHPLGGQLHGGLG